MATPILLENPLRQGLFADRVPAPCSLVIYGASGDLTHRKLVPALFDLYEKHLLPASFSLIGISRSKITDEDFKKGLKEALKQSEPQLSDSLWDSFSQNFHYVAGGYDDAKTYHALSQLLDKMDKENGTAGNRIFYLSTPPNVFENIISNLGASGLAKEGKGFSRVVIEKPFGHDLESAQELNKGEGSLQGKADLPYRPLPGQGNGPKSFGDALRQFHLRAHLGPALRGPCADHRFRGLGGGQPGGLLRILRHPPGHVPEPSLPGLCLVAMEPPVAFEANAIRDEKLKILKSIRPFNEHTVYQWAVRGQYGPGYLAGEKVPGYRQEEGVDPKSNTPTYAALKIFLDTWRWHGVPFLLRSGKRLPKRATEVAIQFKEPPNLLFKSNVSDLSPNVLVIRIQPDEGITLKFETKVPGMTHGSPDGEHGFPLRHQFRRGYFRGL